MANSATLVPGGVVLDDGAGHLKLLRLVPNSNPTAGWADVQIADAVTGQLQATPAVFEMTNSGGRIAAHLPGVDASVCITDPATGKIATS